MKKGEKKTLKNHAHLKTGTVVESRRCVMRLNNIFSTNN